MTKVYISSTFRDVKRCRKTTRRLRCGRKSTFGDEELVEALQKRGKAAGGEAAVRHAFFWICC